MLYYAEFIKRGTWVCVQDIINHSDKCLLRERRVASCDIQIHPGVSDRREIKLVKRKTSGLHFSHYNLMKINDHSREQCRVQNKHRGVYILEFILCHKVYRFFGLMRLQQGQIVKVCQVTPLCKRF